MSSKYVLHKELRHKPNIKYYICIQTTNVEFPECIWILIESAARALSYHPTPYLVQCPLISLYMWSPLVSFTHHFLSTYGHVRCGVNY